MNKEQILCFKRENLPANWLKSQITIKLNYLDFLNQIQSVNYYFEEKQKAENNTQLKQLIPYIILENTQNGKVLIYKRQGNEKRIRGLWSVGVGGHIDKVDKKDKDNIKDIVEFCIKRELKEELLGHQVNAKQIEFLGIMNEELTKVGKVHIAAVFKYKIINNEILRYANELKKNKWLNINTIISDYKLELWSEMALSMLQTK